MAPPADSDPALQRRSHKLLQNNVILFLNIVNRQPYIFKPIFNRFIFNSFLYLVLSVLWFLISEYIHHNTLRHEWIIYVDKLERFSIEIFNYSDNQDVVNVMYDWNHKTQLFTSGKCTGVIPGLCQQAAVVTL